MPIPDPPQLTDGEARGTAWQVWAQGVADAFGQENIGSFTPAQQAALSATYVAFVDQAGNPISGERVRIVVDTTVTPNQISDIVVVS